MSDSPLKPNFDALEILCQGCAHCTGVRYALTLHPGCGMMGCSLSRQAQPPRASLETMKCTHWMPRYVGVDCTPEKDS